jgi:anthraniloyl-CoA monooxygenase
MGASRRAAGSGTTPSSRWPGSASSTFVHANGNSKMSLQLGHAGRQGLDAPGVGWRRHAAAERAAGRCWRPRRCPIWKGTSQVPREMTRPTWTRVKAEFVAATKPRAEAASTWSGAPCAHGYLLSSFISPLTNRRDDEYGGSAGESLPLSAGGFRAMRELWPADKPMSVRISAHDWVAGGITPDDSVEIARLVQRAAGCRHHPRLVRAGQQGRGSRSTGACSRCRSRTRSAMNSTSPTIAVGNIFEADHVNTIIAPVAPIFAPWPARTWPIRPGRCTRRRSRATRRCRMAEAVPGRQDPARTQSRTRGAARAECLIGAHSTTPRKEP